MKNISRLAVAVLIILGLSMSACDKRSDVTRDSLSFEGINTEEVVAEDNLSELFGNMTYGDVLDLLGNSLKTLNALADQGYTTSEDYQTLRDIIENTYNYMLDEKDKYEADPDGYDSQNSGSSDALSTLFKMAVDAKVGVLLNQVIKQAGSSCLTQNIYPMITYAINADDDILNGLINGSDSDSTADSATNFAITRDEFGSLVNFVNKMVDEDGEYGALNESLSVFTTTLKEESNPVTVDDIKDMYDSLDVLAGPYTATGSTEEETSSSPYTDEQSEQIWDSAGDVLKDIIKNNGTVHTSITDLSKAFSIYATSNDFKSTLDGLGDVLAIDQNTLKNYVTQALVGLASSSGSESMNNMLPYIANINTDDADGIAKGLISILWTNWYYKSGAGTVANVKTSGLRALMFMMQESVNSDNVMNKFQIINLMSSPDDSKYGWTPSNWYTNNVAEWTIGEVAHAVEKFGPLNGIDYVLYKKPYKLAAFSLFGYSFSLKSYTGMNAMMSDSMMDLFREDSSLMDVVQFFDSSIQGVDGILDPFPAFKELAGGDGKTYGTAGTRHKLISLFAPLMQSAWDADVEDFAGKNNMPNTRATVDLMAKLNEISHSSYVSLKNSSPTFVQDNQGTVIKKAEPALLLALMDRSTADVTDPGLVGPVLKIAFTVLKGLNNTTSPVDSGETLLTSIINDLNMQEMTSKDQGELVTKLFSDLNEQNQMNLIDNVNLFLTDVKGSGRTNVDNIAEIARIMGKAMDNSNIAGSIVTLIPDLVDDYDALSPIVTKLIPETDDTEEDSSTTDELMDYLTAKINDGNDENPFIVNAKTLAYRVLDVQDTVYNPAGYINGSTPITGPDSLLLHLSDLYSVKKLIFFDAEPMITFLTDATSEDTGGKDALLTLFDEFNKNESGGMIDKVLGRNGVDSKYHRISIQPSFIRALFTDIDNNNDGIVEDAVVYSILKQVKLSNVDNDKEFMQRVLEELYTMTSETSEPEEDTEGFKYDNMILTLENLLNNITVK